MVSQPHGGALRAGGVPGNRGGPGRPPSEVRRIARDMFAARLLVLDQIAEGRVVVPLIEQCARCGYEPTEAEERKRAQAIERAPRPGEQVRAMETLARVGMSGHISIDDIKARLIAQMRALRGWAGEYGVSPDHLEVLVNRRDPVRR